MSSTDRCHPPSSSAPPSFRLNQCKCASDPTSGRRCVLHPSASAAGNQERGDGVVTVEKREEREVMVEAMVVVEKVGRMVEKVEKVGRMVEGLVVEKVGRMVEKVEGGEDGGCDGGGGEGGEDGGCDGGGGDVGGDGGGDVGGDDGGGEEE